MDQPARKLVHPIAQGMERYIKFLRYCTELDCSRELEVRWCSHVDAAGEQSTYQGLLLLFQTRAHNASDLLLLVAMCLAEAAAALLHSNSNVYELLYTD